MKADNDSGGQQWYARLGGGLQRGWTRAGGKRRRRPWLGNPFGILRNSAINPILDLVNSRIFIRI
jgi:hypothetical protein